MRLGPAMGLTVLLAGAALAPAAGGTERTDVAKLFELGSKSAPTAVAAAKAGYERLKRANAKDARLDYAYGLVLIGQHKYKEALALVSDYQRARPDDLEAACARLWLLVQNRRYTDALNYSVEIAGHFPKEHAEIDDDMASLARYLGQMLGYLELTRGRTIDARLRSKCSTQVLERLGQVYRPAFDSGRGAVAEHLARLQGERDQAQQERQAAAEKKQAELQAALAADKQQVDTTQRAIDESTDELADTHRGLSLVRQQLGSLLQDRTRLGTQIMVLQSQLTALQSDLFTSTVTDSRTTPTPLPGMQTNVNTSSRTTIDPGRFAQSQQVASSLLVLNKQALEMDRRIAELRTKGAELGDKGLQAEDTRAANEAAIAKAGKRAKSLEKQAKRLEAKEPPPPAALSAEMTRLSGYVPFPFELEKQRVLAGFK